MCKSNYAFKPIAEQALRSNQTIVPQRLNAALAFIGARTDRSDASRFWRFEKYMPTATKVTFSLAGVTALISVAAATYLMIRIDSLNTEAINAAAREVQINANQSAYEHRAYFRKVWLLPALSVMFSFFGWVEYFKSPQRERERVELIGGLVTSSAGVLMLALFFGTFILSLGGHG